jgi:glyoxylase-like metal-dependent hydrolase (beta-lactamase superfamily II)
MTLEITAIRLPLPLNITTMNSCLIKCDDNFFLVDTGMTNARRKIETELVRLGCTPGTLKLIILTHGDFDHSGNAIYLRNLFGAKIAMHVGDVGMLENGDMFYNRKFENGLMRGVMKAVMPFKAGNRGKPDILLKDGDSLTSYGLDAVIYNTPGHSSGSICILTSSGDLFAGDLLTNSKGKPMLNSMMYDKEAGDSSLERLKTLPIRFVYPGHGQPFRWEELNQNPGNNSK